MSERGKGRIFQPKDRKVLMIAYWGPKKDGGFGQIRESAHTEDPVVARKLLDDRLHEVRNHRAGIRKFQGPSQEKLTVGDLLKALDRDYESREIKSLREVRVRMNAVREFFGARRAVTVNTNLVRRYIEERKDKGKANATVNRETEVLGRAFRLAAEEGSVAFVPKIPRLPEKNARQGFFERQELESMLPHLASPLDDMARFAAICGWRVGEIIPLRWEAVDRNAREIRLADSKNGEGRVLPLDETDWRLFEKLWTLRAFTTKDGQAVSAYVFHRAGKPISRSTFQRDWADAREKAKLPAKLFHDLRRTAARDMVLAGVPEVFAMKITGHRTTSMFRRYNIVTPKELLQALRMRREHVEAQPKESNVTPIARLAE